MSDANGLPKGWVVAKLGDVLPISYGKGLTKKARDDSGDVPVYGSNGIVGTHTEPLTKGGTLIVGRKGSAGAVHYSPVPCWPIDTTYYAEVTDAHNLRYFYYLLNTLQLGSLDRSTAVPSLSRDDYNPVTVAIAPEAEQRRIVAKIEELFSDLDAGVAALERAKANLKRYRAAVLKAAVEGKLTAAWRAENPCTESASDLLQRIRHERRQKWEQQQLAKYAEKNQQPPKNWRAKYKPPAAPDTTNLPDLPAGWCWPTLSQIGILDRGRSRHRPRNAPHLYGGPYPFIQTGDIRHAATFIRRYTQTYSEAGLVQSKMWPAGTLCITIAANIAETAILGFDGCFPDSVVGFLPASDHVSVRFVELFLRTVQQRLESYAPATAQKNINLGTLTDVAICLPPPAEQLEIVSEVDQRLSIVQAAEASIDANRKRAARLRQSILKRAFEGKLVPQDPSDEPAAALLERIGKERLRAIAVAGRSKRTNNQDKRKAARDRAVSSGTKPD